MKTRNVILIIIVIILAHLAVIYCFVWGKPSSAEAAVSAKQEKEEQPAVSLPEKTASAGENVSAGKPEVEGTVKNLLPEEEVKALPLNYVPAPYHDTYAWKGEIPGLPESARARSGILVDLSTRNILWMMNARKPSPIASMTKVMTLLVAYEQILEGKNGLTLDTPVKVSHAAYKMGGSEVYLDPKETFPISELMQTVAIKSANDSAYLVAEYLGGGDINAFVSRMNDRARAIGMTQTKFFNTHGLPGDSAATDNYSSPEDMVRLAEVTLQYPLLMKWAATPRMEFRPTTSKAHMVLENHNNLVPGRRLAAVGVDGLKTGLTDRAGACTVVTCLRGNRRLVAVVMGVGIQDKYKRTDRRDVFARKLLDWGYAYAVDPAASLEALKKKPLQSPKMLYPKQPVARKKAVKTAKPVKKTKAVKKSAVKKTVKKAK